MQRLSIFLALLLAVGLAAPPAQAHAFLVRATPGVGASVAAAPKALKLVFTEALEPVFCNVTVVNGAGQQVQAGRPHAVAGHPKDLLVPLHISAPGHFKVTWHALSVDTHKTQGSFGFTVASAR